MQSNRQKLELITQFKNSEIYQDFLKLGDDYYQGFYKQAMDEKLEDSKRLQNLSKMKGAGLVLGIFDALEKDYKREIEKEENSNAKY